MLHDIRRGSTPTLRRVAWGAHRSPRQNVSRLRLSGRRRVSQRIAGSGDDAPGESSREPIRPSHLGWQGPPDFLRPSLYFPGRLVRSLVRRDDYLLDTPGWDGQASDIVSLQREVADAVRRPQLDRGLPRPVPRRGGLENELNRSSGDSFLAPVYGRFEPRYTRKGT